MTKRKEREVLFKLLFMTEFHGRDYCQKLLENFFEQCELENADSIFKPRMLAFLDAREAIDKMIEDASVGWRIDRMAKVDLTLLRMALFEIEYEGLDVGVAINEAVELAKEYGGERSFAFVNGVLAKIED